MTSAAVQLGLVSNALQQLRDDPLGGAAFSCLAQSQSALLVALPARYTEVLEQLLNSLESSALFTEESCSFSQRELQGSLQTWLDTAELQLHKAKPSAP